MIKVLNYSLWFVSKMTNTGFLNSMEIEVKAKIDNIEKTRERILASGGIPISRNLIKDFSLDFKDTRLRKRDCVLRIRVFENGEGIITFKGPRKTSEQYKIREEIEVHVNDGMNAVKIFERVGFRVTFRIDRIREVYELRDEKVRVMLDVFPEIGAFIEVEGNKIGIEKVIKKLGMKREEFTALTLHHYIEDYKRRFGKTPKLTFDD